MTVTSTPGRRRVGSPPPAAPPPAASIRAVPILPAPSAASILAAVALAAAVLAASFAVAPLPAAAAAATRPNRATIALAPRDPAALAAYARAVSTPGSPDYGRYLRPRAFAVRFGARPARIRALSALLAARGLRRTSASAGGLSISLQGSAATLRRVLGGNADGVRGGAPRVARLPGVQAVIGLAPEPRARPLAVRAAPGGRDPATRAAARSAARAAPVASRVTSAAPRACPAAAAAAPQQSAYTDEEIAGTYDFDPLYAAGDEGQGVTVAVYELEPDAPADIAAYQRCYGTHATISDVPVDGGVEPGAGSDEAAFDIENLIGFAPRIRLLVYQGPNAASGLPGSGPYDIYSAIVNQDRAQVVSVSWGQCETQLGRPSAGAEHTLFEQAAVEGQTIVAASGDYGAEDCDSGGHGSSTHVAVDDPASQPAVLAVGGTTLRIGSPTSETAWNSGGTPNALATAPGAGGGGVSAFWAMGIDQLDAPVRLHVRRAAAAAAACGLRSGYCRESPDVAADSDPATGYEIYWNGADTQPEPSGWQGLGGTSGAAPLWAGLIALADGLPACHGTPLGLAGTAIYRAAADHYAADFRDITSGDNDFTGTSGGRWSAGAGYDLTTGLGTPRAAALAATLCADALRVLEPASQSSALGAAIALRVRTHDLRGQRLTFTASHLPAGVRLDPATGRLSGRPRKPGVYHVRTEVSDPTGGATGGRFTWGIGGPPRLTRVALGGGRLTVTLASARSGPSLRELRLTLPAGLRVTGAPRLASESARARVTGGAVMFTPSSPLRTATVSVPVRGAPPRGARLAVAAETGTTGTTTLEAVLP